MQLSAAHTQIIGELARGSRLQDHRNLDGDKVYQLHPLGAALSVVIDAALMADLQRHHLLASNMKFPAATYLLTDKGMALAKSLTSLETLPLGAKNYPVAG